MGKREPQIILKTDERSIHLGSMNFETTPLGAPWASANGRSSSKRTSGAFTSS
jgi:hypothetical protein